MTHRIIITLTLVITLAGCATTYKEFGAFGGYAERKLSASEFLLEVNGNGFTSYETLEVYYHKRASELCNGKYLTTDIRRIRMRDAPINPNYLDGRHPTVVGNIKCTS